MTVKWIKSIHLRPIVWDVHGRLSQRKLDMPVTKPKQKRQV